MVGAIKSNYKLASCDVETILLIRHKSGNPTIIWPEPDFGQICKNSRISARAGAEFLYSPNWSGRPWISVCAILFTGMSDLPVCYPPCDWTISQPSTLILHTVLHHWDDLWHTSDDCLNQI